MKSKTKTATTSNIRSLNDLEKTLQVYFGEKAPQLPENVKEAIVKYGPYIALVLLVLSLPALLGALGLGAVLSPIAFFGGVGAGLGITIGLLISIIALVLQIIALPGLFKRLYSSWRIMFMISIINALGNLINFNLGSLIIGTVISWYFLFQIREYYK